MEPEPEAADDVKQSAGAKINGKINAVLKEHSETSPLGLSGPTLRGQVSRHAAGSRSSPHSLAPPLICSRADGPCTCCPRPSPAPAQL
jgi:hypothetical protein